MYSDIVKILKEWLQEVVPEYRTGGIAFKKRAVFNDGESFPSSYILDIYTDVPGYLVGKAGSIADKYKAKLIERVKCYHITDINIFEVAGFVVKPIDEEKVNEHINWAKNN